MQLSSINAPTAPTGVPASATAAPTFTGGIEFTGTGGRFSAFSATADGGAYGNVKGYATLPKAIDALTDVTVGVHQPAAGVFELDGRFYGRRLANTVTFSGGKTWTGMWRLEQHPQDRELLTPDAKGTTRAAAIRAVVDGAQRIDVTHLPTA